jgi:hypothetical protein
LSINPPAPYLEWLSELPQEARFDGAQERYDFIHWFVTNSEELSRGLEDLAAALKSTGMIWVS